MSNQIRQCEVDETHASALKSWVPGADGHPDFPVQNLPLGIHSQTSEERRTGVAIGDCILDLVALRELLSIDVSKLIDAPTLNPLLGARPEVRKSLRRRLSQLLSQDDYRADVEPALRPEADCRLHLPATIGDYTDFYVGIHHATNVGRLFRPDSPLLPNYKHLPIGYHGRASSVRPSGIPVIRPSGQSKRPEESTPCFGPSNRLDYELELGIWIGEGNAPGTTIPIGTAARQRGTSPAFAYSTTGRRAISRLGNISR